MGRQRPRGVRRSSHATACLSRLRAVDRDYAAAAGRTGSGARTPMTDGNSSALRRLAERVGILSEYLDQTGRETRHTSDDTRRALLAAMRVESHEQLDEEERADLIPP